VGGEEANLVALGRELDRERFDMAPDSTWIRVRVGRHERYTHPSNPIGHTYGVTDARNFVKYTFLKVDPAWRRRSAEERASDKREFAAACREFGGEHYLRAYSLVGTRGDCDLMVRAMARTLDPIHELHVLLNQSGLMRFADVPYSYLAMTKESPYSDEPDKPLEPRAGADSKYLIVYPMWKRRDWYRLPGEERMRVMRDHIAVARRFTGIETNTAYSFGLDDQEFVVAFDADDPAEFLDLVQELRATESSAYTESETPIFTCMSASLERALDALDGERVRATA
jgi:chlorite dismutase